MPFDGVVTKCIVDEFKATLIGGRIDKIFQPEKDELIINIRSQSKNYKLLMSANPSYPRVHFTEVSKENPAVPPVFCMLLRKHLGGGKITDVIFHDFERIVTICAESINELGDLVTKKLVIEIMGRHSNIILLNNEDKILDAIKHVDKDISSIREVMPARPYTLPPVQDKHNPVTADIKSIIFGLDVGIKVEKVLLDTFRGFSPLLCREICFRAQIDSRKTPIDLTEEEKISLCNTLLSFIEDIKAERYIPSIAYADEDNGTPVDFHCFPMNQYSKSTPIDTMSEAIDRFYVNLDHSDRLKQKKSGVQKVLHNALERCRKKIAIQNEKLAEVQNREHLKLYGELLTANIYCLESGSKIARVLNYYSENEEYVDIDLDENKTIEENAQVYYKKYNKAKSTFSATTKQLEDSQAELEYLESVQALLDDCQTPAEIEEIRQELGQQGYLIIKGQRKKGEKIASPLVYVSSDGLQILVGRNNIQNDKLTLKTASSNDIWLHTKNIPGSHVIIKKQHGPIPNNTLFEAAVIASWHSKAKMSSNVEVDCTEIRNVKKPSGAKPGRVIYVNYQTFVVNPDKEIVQKLKK